MASEAQLRGRIRDLQTQIESLRHQNENFQNSMTRQMNQRLAELKAEYQRALIRQKNDTEALYTERIRTFQEQMTREMQQQYSALEAESARISKLQEDKLAELSECNEELRSILQRMKSRTETAESNQREYANSQLAQLEISRNDADAAPHEFFYKGEFEIIDSHAAQIQDEIRQEMYQAASADASSVMMEFDLLKTKVEQALHEWMMAFQDYARIVRSISERIRFLEGEPIDTVAGKFIMAPQELNFWSSGTYLPYKQKILEASRMIEEVSRAGVVDYLKGQKSQPRKGIFAKVSEARKWDDELTGITNCIMSERLLSDERWAAAGRVRTQLKKIGYSAKRKRYRQPAADVRAAEWYPKDEKYRQNPLESYELIETIQGTDLLHITFVPVRANGIAVRNECIISMTAESLRDAELARDIIGVNVDRVKSAVKEMPVSGVVGGEAQLAAEEKRRKKNPDPQEQIRYLEKKYH